MIIDTEKLEAALRVEKVEDLKRIERIEDEATAVGVCRTIDSKYAAFGLAIDRVEKLARRLLEL